MRTTHRPVTEATIDDAREWAETDEQFLFCESWLWGLGPWEKCMPKMEYRDIPIGVLESFLQSLLNREETR